MATIQTYDLNIKPNGECVVVRVSQWDSGNRILRFNLFDDVGAFSIPSGATVEIRGTKNDGKGIAVSNVSNPESVAYSGSQVNITTFKQLTAIEGEQEFKLSISSNGSLIASARFILYVDADTLSDDTDISDSEIPAIIALAEEQLRQATQQAQLSKSYAQGHSESGRTGEDTDNAKYYKELAQTASEASEGFSEDSEAWATGKRNNVDVPSTDATYQNNAAYYAGVAESEAIDAASSASSAVSHEREAEAWAKGTKNGVAVDSTAPQYHDNAKYWNDKTNSDGEAWTRGSRGGVDVPSTDETYHNNAKYFSEQADAIGEAWNQQTNSDGEAWTKGTRGGTPVTSTDPTYENNAKYWSNQSRDHATASEASRQAARLSEQNAKASEDILAFYADFVIPHFIISNNRLYISDTAQGEFIIANNRLYIKNAS